MNSAIHILYLLGAAQGAFLVIALFGYGGGNRTANRYLGFLTLVFVAALFDYYMDGTGIVLNHPWLRTLLWPKEFLYGTLVYFYVRELTLPGRYPLRGRQLLHFVPFVLHVLLTWPLLALDGQRQLAILAGEAHGGIDGAMAFILGDLELALTIVQLSIYILLSLREISAHNQRILDNFSDVERINLRWLSRLLFGVFIVYLVWLGEELLSNWLHQELLWDALLGLSMVVLIYTMGYLALRQPLIFSAATAPVPDATPDTAPGNAGSDSTTASDKYRNSPISRELGASLLHEVQTHMQENKPYLNGKLSLPELADQLSMPLSYLSQVINEQTGSNFFDFVNGYRVVEAQAHLSSDTAARKSIVDLAMDVGFNSKSAFYNAFRKHTGMTPTQFRKERSGLQ